MASISSFSEIRELATPSPNFKMVVLGSVEAEIRNSKANGKRSPIFVKWTSFYRSKLSSQNFNVCVCVCVINSLSCLNEKNGRQYENENIDRKMLRRKNQLSVDENI